MDISFFLQRLYCLTCLTKKKKLQPQSSYAKMIEEHAIIFHTSRTFNEFSFKVTAAFITFLFHIKIHHILKIP